MDIKETFNWLVEKPQHNYTVGEAWQRHVTKKAEADIIPSTKPGFTRAGRITERAILLTGVARSAIIAGLGLLTLGAAPPLGAVLLVASAFNLAGAKIAGVISGKIVDFVAKGLNRIAQSPKLKQAAPKV